jgi:hypothetical protein
MMTTSSNEPRILNLLLCHHDHDAEDGGNVGLAASYERYSAERGSE